MIETRTVAAEDAEEILARSEGHFCDLKGRDIKPSKLSETLSAFANTAGAEIFIGIEEIGHEKVRKWDRFPDEEAANAIFAVIEQIGLSQYCSFTFLHCKDKEGIVLFIEIQKTRAIISATNGMPYIRRGAQNYPSLRPKPFDALNSTKV